MKTLYSILANLASLVFGYLFVSHLNQANDFSHVLIMSMLALLFFIFVILGILSFPKRAKQRSFFYNSYSSRRTKNDDFDRLYSLMNK